MNLEVGTIVDGLRILGILGEGATSQVYLVSDLSAGGDIRALKLLSVVGRTYRKRLQRESEAIAMARHPNIVSVHRMVEHEGMTGILMEFVAGPTLRRWLQTAEPHGVECLAIAVGLLRGLQELHDKQLVHRDIKPGNIILATDYPQVVVPRLLDFGLVKHLGTEKGMTITGSSMGTPAYMAPEQLRDASRVDHRADLYSLGCVLFEMIAGARPFSRDEWVDAYQHLGEGSPVEMDRLPPTTPPHVSTVLEALLEPDPDDRPASADEVIAMLTDPYPPEHPIHSGQLRRGDFGGRIAQGLALVQADALRPQELSEGVLAVPLSTASQAYLTSDPAYAPTSAPSTWRVLALVAVSVLLGLLVGGGAWAIAAGVVGDRQPESTARLQVEAQPTPPAEPTVTPQPAELPPSDAPPSEVPPSEAPPEPRPPADRRPRPPDPTPPSITPEADPPTGDDPNVGPTDPPETVELVAISIQGDAESVRLQSESGQVLDVDEPVPPGDYEIRARWVREDDFVPAGRVQLEPGAATTITCRRAFFQCRG